MTPQVFLFSPIFNFVTNPEASSPGARKQGMHNYSLFRYNKNLGAAEKQGIKKGMIQGIFTGYMWCMIFLSYALAFWYGASLVFENTGFTPGRLMTVRTRCRLKKLEI